jgi:hypothetical protein
MSVHAGAGADEALLRRYLLGTLSEEEQYRLEEAYFRDDALFATLLEAAEEIAEASRRGELSRSERAAFERRVLSSREWRGRLRAASVLQRLASRAVPAAPAGTTEPPARIPWPLRRWALATLGAASLVALLAVALLRSGPPSPAGSPGQPGPAAFGGVGQAPEPPAVGPAPAARAVELSLRTAGFRDAGEAPVLRLEPGVALVRLRLPLARDRHERYRAVVRTAEGASVATVAVERDAAGPELIAEVPAARLRPADYILTLQGAGDGKGFEDVADYYFRVAARQR